MDNGAGAILNNEAIIYLFMVTRGGGDVVCVVLQYCGVCSAL